MRWGEKVKKTITHEQVRKIAYLARLEFTEQEREAFFHDLNEILAHFEKLDVLDLSNVSPTSHITWTAPPVNPDQAVEWGREEEVLRTGPDVRDRYFIVPKIVEKQEG